ncbi:hypothetical protein ACFQZC_07030 [Streptacidiphilus monticola]
MLALFAALLLQARAPGAARADGVPAGFTMPAGLDLHDGQIARFGDTYYAYGTEYRCGFRWGVHGTPFCGFGVSSAPALDGPWSRPRLLFSPRDVDTWRLSASRPGDYGRSWNWVCGADGAGCFNPRMIRRSGWGSDDGVFLLWFNAPGDWNRYRANAYYAMGCNGPAGPCGHAAGPPHGSTTKPSLPHCAANGDFGVSLVPGGRPVLVCTCPGPDQKLAEEELNRWGTGSDGRGATGLAGLTRVEGPGLYPDPATGTWILTYSDPACGYCSGTGTGYATAPGPLGPWTAPVNLAAAAPPPGGRRDLSATSCGGQPRTVSFVDGQAWQGIDLWTGNRNEAAAGWRMEPLVYVPTRGTAGDGRPWRPPFLPWTCDR